MTTMTKAQLKKFRESLEAKRIEIVTELAGTP